MNEVVVGAWYKALWELRPVKVYSLDTGLVHFKFEGGLPELREVDHFLKVYERIPQVGEVYVNNLPGGGPLRIANIDGPMIRCIHPDKTSFTVAWSRFKQNSTLVLPDPGDAVFITKDGKVFTCKRDRDRYSYHKQRERRKAMGVCMRCGYQREEDRESKGYATCEMCADAEKLQRTIMAKLSVSMPKPKYDEFCKLAASKGMKPATYAQHYLLSHPELS